MGWEGGGGGERDDTQYYLMKYIYKDGSLYPLIFRSGNLPSPLMDIFSV